MDANVVSDPIEPPAMIRVIVNASFGVETIRLDRTIFRRACVASEFVNLVADMSHGFQTSSRDACRRMRLVAVGCGGD
jgi:hypothetical protein